MSKAHSESWILVTNDRDFGDKVFREHHPHHGIIFLRLVGERPASKICALTKLLANHADQLVDSFVVVTESQVRFSQPFE